MPKKGAGRAYVLQWISLRECRCRHIEEVVTDEPKWKLFNFACAMLVVSNRLFGSLPAERIADNIQEGRMGREHYWIEYPGGEVLSIMEKIEKEEANK